MQICDTFSTTSRKTPISGLTRDELILYRNEMDDQTKMFFNFELLKHVVFYDLMHRFDDCAMYEDISGLIEFAKTHSEDKIFGNERCHEVLYAIGEIIKEPFWEISEDANVDYNVPIIDIYIFLEIKRQFYPESQNFKRRRGE